MSVPLFPNLQYWASGTFSNLALNGNYVLSFFANMPTGVYMVASTESCSIPALSRADMAIVTVDQNNPSAGFGILDVIGTIQTGTSGLPAFFWMIITPTSIFIKNDCTNPSAATNTINYSIYKLS